MPNSTVLSLVQSYCREYNLPVPTALQGSSDAGALQLREILQRSGREAWKRANWQKCSRRISWASVAGADQGNLDTLFPENFANLIPNTLWNQTQRRRILGPVADGNWQIQQAVYPTGPLYHFRIAQNRLQISTAMPAGHTLSAIYKTQNWMTSGGVDGARYLTDADLSYFSDDIMLAGLRAYWLRAKQMPHVLEMEEFDNVVRQEASKNTVAPVLYMDAPEPTSFPGIIIPTGNWINP